MIDRVSSSDGCPEKKAEEFAIRFKQEVDRLTSCVSWSEEKHQQFILPDGSRVDAESTALGEEDICALKLFQPPEVFSSGDGQEYLVQYGTSLRLEPYGDDQVVAQPIAETWHRQSPDDFWTKSDPQPREAIDETVIQDGVDVTTQQGILSRLSEIEIPDRPRTFEEAKTLLTELYNIIGHPEAPSDIDFRYRNGDLKLSSTLEGDTLREYILVVSEGAKEELGYVITTKTFSVRHQGLQVRETKEIVPLSKEGHPLFHFAQVTTEDKRPYNLIDDIHLTNIYNEVRQSCHPDDREV